MNLIVGRYMFSVNFEKNMVALHHPPEVRQFGRSPWLPLPEEDAKALIEVFRELRKARSNAHVCVQCGSGIGVFRANYLCPSCSND